MLKFSFLGVFADKHTGVVYNYLTGKFPFMSLDGNQCFFVMYHYESNAILVKPISGLDDESIFVAYKDRFDYLESKGFKIKINIMNNQATKQVKRFLTTKGIAACTWWSHTTTDTMRQKE